MLYSEAVADKTLLGERECMTLCYELAMRDTANYKDIVNRGREVIKSVDRLKEFNYIIRAVNPNKATRDSLFALFVSGKEREIEPWCQVALGYLNHPLLQQQAIGYIRPALDALGDVQRTGDIFFPKGWIQAVLRGHKSKAAADSGKQFLQETPTYQDLMTKKILQSVGHLRHS